MSRSSSCLQACASARLQAGLGMNQVTVQGTYQWPERAPVPANVLLEMMNGRLSGSCSRRSLRVEMFSLSHQSRTPRVQL